MYELETTTKLVVFNQSELHQVLQFIEYRQKQFDPRKLINIKTEFLKENCEEMIVKLDANNMEDSDRKLERFQHYQHGGEVGYIEETLNNYPMEVNINTSHFGQVNATINRCYNSTFEEVYYLIKDAPKFEMSQNAQEYLYQCDELITNQDIQTDLKLDNLKLSLEYDQMVNFLIENNIKLPD